MARIVAKFGGTSVSFASTVRMSCLKRESMRKTIVFTATDAKTATKPVLYGTRGARGVVAVKNKEE